MARILGTALLLFTLLGVAGCAPHPLTPDTRCLPDGSLKHVGNDYHPWRDNKVVKWDRYEVLSSRCLLVHFTGETDVAFKYRYALEEDDSRISITVFQGLLPEAPESWKGPEQEQTLIVLTEKPIGSRTIVPGN